jgi:hypothetical protein
MSRKQQTLRYLFEGDIIRIPNIADTGSSRHQWMMSLLDFLKEIAEKHGSERLTWEGNSYWQAQFGEHEKIVIVRWLSWHQQYEAVATMPDLFVIPIDTGEVKL